MDVDVLHILSPLVNALVDKIHMIILHGVMIRAADIRALRAYLHETQEQFGKRFGRSRFTVIYWERFGIDDPRASVERIMGELRRQQETSRSSA